MTLRLSGGGEEGHSHSTSGSAVGIWESLVDIDIADNTIGPVHTGFYCYKFLGLADGASPGATGNKVWWSHSLFFTAWGDGSYRYLWDDLIYGTDYAVKLNKGSSASKAKLALVVPGVGDIESDEFASGPTIQLFKWECDEGYWTFWGNLDAGGWEELFTYDDTENFDGPFSAQMNPNATTDEGKGADYVVPYIDDVHMWDDSGDTWNSRLPSTYFPRVSVAHRLVSPDNIDPDQYDKLDDVPVGGDRVTASKADYYSAVEDLRTGVSPYTTRPDLTGEYIQALIVTKASYAPTLPDMEKYHLYDGGTEFLDSEEALVQTGYTVDPGDTTDATYAGSYPWTPNGENWTEDLMESYMYGAPIVSGKSDQITVQVIFFDDATDFLWKPTVAARRIFIT